MIYIILASIFAAFGSYILRKGDLINLINSIINLNMPNNDLISYTIIGILLNIISIVFWQSSIKSNINFSVCLSLYLSLSLVNGVLISAIFDKLQLGINFYIGTAFIILGVIIISKNNI